MSWSVEEFVGTSGALDVGQTVQFLQETAGYRHDPSWRKGRCRTFRHGNNPRVLTFREQDGGVIFRREADKVRRHVMLSHNLPEAAENEDAEADT